jgi:hypothetical protein
MLWASEILNVTITEPQELFCYEEEGVRLMATLDGKDLSGKIYELKTYNKRWNGQLPPYWKWQGVQQAICADANEITWIVFDSDLQLQFHTQTVTSDERQQHIDAVRKFLGFIDMGMMPEGADPTYDNASALYPEGYENTVVLGHEVYNTLERLSIAKEQIKSAATRNRIRRIQRNRRCVHSFCRWYSPSSCCSDINVATTHAWFDRLACQSNSALSVSVQYSRCIS